MTQEKPKARAKGRVRRIAVNAGLAAVSASIAIVLAELAIRVVAPQQLILIRPDLWEPADTVGWRHRPDVNVEINTGERTVRVYTDQQGFRVGEGIRPTEGGRRVLLLGDSFMEALQVEYEQSTAGLLEEQLTEWLGEEVWVRNAGVGGWDTDQYALAARKLLPNDAYDLVITSVYLGNDIVPQRRDYVPPRSPVERYRLRFPRSLSGREITDAFFRPVNDFLEVRSHLYLFFKNRLQTLRMGVGLAPLTFPPEFLKSEVNAERWQLTAALCAEIQELAAAHEADALFVLVPAPFQVDSMDLRRYVQGFDLDMTTIDLDQPNRLLGEALSARGVSAFDALPAFRVAHQTGTRLYGSVDPHLTIEGNELLARLVAPFSAELLERRR